MSELSQSNVTCVLDRFLHEQVRTASAKSGKSVSRYVKDLIQQHFSKEHVIDSDEFKRLIKPWIRKAIEANGGISELKLKHELFPGMLSLIVGYVLAGVRTYAHPEPLTVDEMRRTFDLTRQMMEGENP